MTLKFLVRRGRVRAGHVAILAIGLSTAAASSAMAQVSAAPEVSLPEVTVDTEAVGQPTAKKKKAPAAAQQVSTPRRSDAPASSGGAAGPAGPDTSSVAVAPTGEPLSVDKVASSVTVITSKEIEAQQRRTLPDVLRNVPGLNVVQTGGTGGLTSIFMRGTNSNHTKVLIDGIDVSDPSSANRTFDYGQMLAMDIERIEVLRGPQSGLYGADALGGVILIYTKKGEGPPKATGILEGGSFGTFNQAASVSGSQDKVNYSFNVSHVRADAVPVTPRGLLPPGFDRFDNRYDNVTLSSKVGVDVSRELSFNSVIRFTDARLYFTGDDPIAFPSHPNNAQSKQEVQQVFTRNEAVLRSFGGNLTSYFGINYSNLQSDNRSPNAPNFSFGDGERLEYDWRSVATIAPGYTFIAGAEHTNEQLRVPGLFAEEYNRGGFIEAQTEPLHNLFIVANARIDDNESFGTHATWRVAPAYVIEETGTKIKGSVGTAFKAPSLSQRFQDYPDFLFFGNPDLKPEESTGYDVGFEQSVFGGRAQFGATYFRNDISELIQGTFDPNTFVSTLINIGNAKTEGVEVFASADITDDIRVRADYTYTDATNEDTGAWLQRRPRNKASFNVGWTPTNDLLLTGSVLYYGESLDLDRSTFAAVILPSFTVVNVAADYKLTENMSVYGRIDNLFNEHYEIPDGFLATGIGAYAGIRFTN